MTLITGGTAFSRIREELGYKPGYDLEQGLRVYRMGLPGKALDAIMWWWVLWPSLKLVGQGNALTGMF